MIPANGFNLAATASRPPGTTPAAVRLPAVVLVGGSGPADRDESLAGIPIFAQIAGALADAGFLVIRYDKRGVGQSGGRAESATIADYAEDLRAAVKYASKRKDVDKNRVAVLGHGEGGWVALVAASKEKAVKAVVLAETAATTGSELVLEQQRQALSRMNIPEAEKQAKIDLQQKIDQAVLSGRGWDDIPRDVRRQAETPWFQSFLAFTPAPVLKKVKVPILIVQGELDTQVPPHHADDLAALARARKDSRVEVVKVPGVNHLLVPARSGEAGEYADLKDATVSAPLMSAVVDWLHKAIPVKP
jgi:pimeloyl-ACP methyl ester carboxylesterase